MKLHTLEFLKNLARGINSVFGDRCEVAIHDFSNIKSSLVHIEGHITRRKVGSALPDMLYRLLKEFGDAAPDKFGYKSTTQDGQILKCSTTMVRDEQGRLEGCLSINFNVTDFTYLATAFNDFTFLAAKSGIGAETTLNQDELPNTFAETMESAIDFVVADHGKAPAMLKKADKLEIMQQLNKDGVFMIKGSVDYIARVFGASKYTIYNYLKQIRNT